MDERGDPGDQHSIKRIAAATVHSAWPNSGRVANDFGIVTVADALGDHISKFSYAEEVLTRDEMHVIVIGFPDDMPDGAKGKQLCCCPGAARYEKSNGSIIAHMANTATGACGNLLVPWRDS